MGLEASLQIIRSYLAPCKVLGGTLQIAGCYQAFYKVLGATLQIIRRAIERLATCLPACCKSLPSIPQGAWEDLASHSVLRDIFQGA